MKEMFKTFLVQNNAWDKYRKALWAHHKLSIPDELERWKDDQMHNILYYSIAWQVDEPYWARLHDQWKAKCNVKEKRAARKELSITNDLFEI